MGKQIEGDEIGIGGRIEVGWGRSDLGGGK